MTTNNSTAAYKLVVPADFEYVDRSLATASWYDVYTIKAGEYPITLTDVNYRPVKDSERPYYGTWKLDAILTEEYRVNRLFTASSAHTTNPEQETQVHGSCYGYELKDGAAFYTTHGTQADNWKRTINATIVTA